MHIHGLPDHIHVHDGMNVVELAVTLADAGLMLRNTGDGGLEAVPIDCSHPTMTRKGGHWHCLSCPAVLTEKEVVEYRPPLRLDEPAPGGGRKRMHQDLSFPEEEI